MWMDILLFLSYVKVSFILSTYYIVPVLTVPGVPVPTVPGVPVPTVPGVSVPTATGISEYGRRVYIITPCWLLPCSDSVAKSI